MRLLITGINGLIGTILRSALQQTHTVYGLDRVGAEVEYYRHA